MVPYHNMNASTSLERRARILGIPVTGAAGRRVANSTLLRSHAIYQTPTPPNPKPRQRVSRSKKAMLLAGLMLAGASRGISSLRPNKHLALNSREVTAASWPQSSVNMQRSHLLKNKELKKVYEMTRNVTKSVDPRTYHNTLSTFKEKYYNTIAPERTKVMRNDNAENSQFVKHAQNAALHAGKVAGNSMKPGIHAVPGMDPIIAYMLPWIDAAVGASRKNAFVKEKHFLRNAIQKGNTTMIHGGVTAKLAKMPSDNKLALNTLRDWISTQVYMSKANVPLSTQDKHQQLLVIDVVKQVLNSNPLCQEKHDSMGIAPGTHLAVPYKKGHWFVGKGMSFFSPKLARNKVKLHWSGWGDESGFSGLNAVFHHGIYLGNGWVIHVGGGGYARIAAGTHLNRVGLVPLTEFNFVGRGLYVVEHSTKRPRQQIVFDAIQAIGPWKYSIYGRNCEHFATEMATGKPESAQVERAMWALALIATGAVWSAIAIPHKLKMWRSNIVAKYRDASKYANAAIEGVKAQRRHDVAESVKISTALARGLNEPPGPIIANIQAAALPPSRLAMLRASLWKKVGAFGF